MVRFFKSEMKVCINNLFSNLLLEYILLNINEISLFAFFLF